VPEDTESAIDKALTQTQCVKQQPAGHGHPGPRPRSGPWFYSLALSPSHLAPTRQAALGFAIDGLPRTEDGSFVVTSERGSTEPGAPLLVSSARLAGRRGAAAAGSRASALGRGRVPGGSGKLEAPLAPRWQWHAAAPSIFRATAEAAPRIAI